MDTIKNMDMINDIVKKVEEIETIIKGADKENQQLEKSLENMGSDNNPNTSPHVAVLYQWTEASSKLHEAKKSVDELHKIIKTLQDQESNQNTGGKKRRKTKKRGRNTKKKITSTRRGTKNK